MAIECAVPRFLSRSNGDRPVHTASYNMRQSLYDERLGKAERNWDPSTLISHDIYLPPEANPAYLDAQTKWNMVDAREHRIDSQTAFEVVLPLDPSLTHEERRDQVKTFVYKEFIAHGFSAQVDIHEDKGRFHAHVLTPTRRFNGPELATHKARDFFVEVKKAYGKPYVLKKDKWGPKWGDHQAAWFAAHGKAITVDPVAPMPALRVGVKRFRHPDNPRVAENARRQEINTKIAREAPAEYLASQGRFDEPTLGRFLSKHIPDPVERLKIQANAAAKLAALQQDALFKAKYADKTDIGAPMTLEDAGRRVSKHLDDLLREAAKLRDDARTADFVIRQMNATAGAGESRVQQRKAIMTIPQKLAHKVLSGSAYLQKHWGDAEINRGEVKKRRGRTGSETPGRVTIGHWKLEQKRIQDRLAAIALAAAAELTKILPAAQAELDRRQRIARNARALADADNSARTIKVKRARSRSITP